MIKTRIKWVIEDREKSILEEKEEKKKLLPPSVFDLLHSVSIQTTSVADL